MAWGQLEKDNWFKAQTTQRSYLDLVVRKILKLKTRFDLVQYGSLSLNPDCYPLYLLKSKNMNPSKKTVLITGGVHGYETSGVYGALEFLKRASQDYAETFNLVCVPCISPWAFETINRWNPKAIDPNRSFRDNSPAEECRFFLDIISKEKLKPFAHFDLHETTDTDNSVFVPALAERDGADLKIWETPDGFYLVADSENPQKEFQTAVIEAVRKVTHIAPDDGNGKIIGADILQEGVICYPLKKLFLCAGFSDAEYTTTTEVYPDSPKLTNAICVEAQVAAVSGGLDFLKALR